MSSRFQAIVQSPWRWLFGLSMCAIISLAACAPMEEQARPDYNETKQLVLDILQTEEGKKTIQEIMKEEEFKQQLLINEPVVKKTIQDTMLQADNKEKWQQLMLDPKFAKEYAKQLESQHKQLLKDLMKDPEYQSAMMDILKDPEMEKQFIEVAKSKEFRQETMNIMKEAMQSPYFRLELLQLLSQVAKEMEGKQQEQQGGQGQDQQSDQGGGQ
ncbi:spore germination protein D [Caldalkalibacillus uzonensis]|uniref:Spore germination protein D n=1 Tax=Caldalkalibacillus uzonensis TaxID=353224 RepID=A0ABU0CUX3_9BACI|nr:spore germination lipoprotein GerD [Caldalkalibacillus uzonensis]MDQ0340224.1 spore germination protein D [Caldalkalibacillus uzonensis]